MATDGILSIMDGSVKAEDAVKKLAVQLALAAAQAALMGTGPLAGLFGGGGGLFGSLFGGGAARRSVRNHRLPASVAIRAVRRSGGLKAVGFQNMPPRPLWITPSAGRACASQERGRQLNSAIWRSTVPRKSAGHALPWGKPMKSGWIDSLL